jgi:hypothetical protein
MKIIDKARIRLLITSIGFNPLFTAEGFLPSQSRREMDGVIAAQAVLPREALGSLYECFCDGHACEIGPIPGEPS